MRITKRIRLQEAKHKPVGELVLDLQCIFLKKKPVRTIWMCHTYQVLLCLKKETMFSNPSYKVEIVKFIYFLCMFL